MPRKTKEDTYNDILAKFMSFRDGQNWASNTVFTQQQLVVITPLELKRWMQLKAYGTPDPDDDVNPTHGQLASLEFYKRQFHTACHIDSLRGVLLLTEVNQPDQWK